MKAVRDVKKTDSEIQLLLRSSNPRERSLALMFIGKQRAYAMLSVSVEALSDPEPDVRAMAAWALDRLGSPQTVPVLLEAMHDPVFGVRSNAGWALVHMAQRIMPQVVVPDVIDVLRGSNNDDARQMAFLVLYHIGGEVAQEAIRQWWRR